MKKFMYALFVSLSLISVAGAMQQDSLSLNSFGLPFVPCLQTSLIDEVPAAAGQGVTAPEQQNKELAVLKVRLNLYNSITKSQKKLVFSWLKVLPVSVVAIVAAVLKSNFLLDLLIKGSVLKRICFGFCGYQSIGAIALPGVFLYITLKELSHAKKEKAEIEKQIATLTGTQK